MAWVVSDIEAWFAIQDKLDPLEKRSLEMIGAVIEDYRDLHLMSHSEAIGQIRSIIEELDANGYYEEKKKLTTWVQE